MHIFLYEFITGGGGLSEPQPLPKSLLCEGSAMAQALAEDFLRIDGMELSLMRDHRLNEFELPGCHLATITTPEEEREQFHRLAARADWTVLIAPEIDAHLVRRGHWVAEAGGKALASPLETLALLSDKHRTAEHLADHGVAVPHGRVLHQGESLPCNFQYPAVVKPLDGAGSLGVEFIETARSDFVALDRDYRLECFVSGKPASVAVLCGSSSFIALPACLQHLSSDGHFVYSGGSLPLPIEEVRRAERLALQAIESLGPVLGYLGIDMVLGAAEDGSEDYVIEINPRLTTSYVGLRAATDDNLARAMLDLAHGREVSLSMRDAPIQFEADGSVHHAIRSSDAAEAAS